MKPFSMVQHHRPAVFAAVAACLAGAGWLLSVPTPAAGAASVPKWERFEQTFESGTTYANPVQEATLVVTFTSPSGKSRKAYGFWDGGSAWRVRFSPNETGAWKFKTTCSDAANKGLHDQAGEFNCVAATGKTRWTQHGPLRVSPDGRYLMHEDATPFLWLGDTAWNGALLSTPEDWATYIKTRAGQKFTAVQFVTTQWRAAPEGDATKTLAYTGKEKIAIQPGFFQRLDARLDALSEAGLLSVPVMLWAINGGSNPQVNPGVSLPVDQAVLLGRYMLARWGAHPVAWILAGDGDYRGEKAERWKQIGRGIFGDLPHGPVTLHPGGMQWVWNEFKDEPWYDFVGFQSGHGDDDKALKWLIEGPPAEDWARLPHRPFINLEPAYEAHIAYQSKQPISADFTRRALCWSLLSVPTAGVTYGGHGVWGWDDGTKPPTDHPGSGTPQPWQKALQLPCATQVKHIHDFLSTNEWWRLQPAPAFVVNNPGKDKPGKFIAVGRTLQKDVMIAYVPEDRTVEIKLDALPPSPQISWFNPRTGETSAAVGVVTTDTCQFPSPAEGDWFLLMRTGK